MDGDTHPNICPYLGVVLDGSDRIVGIAYKRYDTCLFDAVTSNSVPEIFEAATISHIMHSVETGMNHLHRLGLVHCDIRPENIFLSKAKNGTAMEVGIGDFDSAKVARSC